MLYLAGGTWRDAKGDPIDPPKAIAYGKPTAGALVDSEGVSEHTGKSIKEDKTDETSTHAFFVTETPDKKKKKDKESADEVDGGTE